MMSIDARREVPRRVARGRVLHGAGLSDYTGTNVGDIPDLTDTGYQVQASAMAVKDLLQVYATGSQVFGDYGKPSEFRAGGNWYFMGPEVCG